MSEFCWFPFDARVDSPYMQMFLFGSLALEQFVDRLIEWPQYCNHILQISHLRSTHVEIVAFIEQALARISSGHADIDGISHPSAINNHNSLQATSGHMEVSSKFILYLMSNFVWF